MDQTRSNQQSTKSARSNHVFAAVHEITGKIATDQTEFFLLPSSNGNNYLLIVFDYDSNYIHAEPMKSRSGANILEAYKQAVIMFIKHGLKPKLQPLVNEATAVLKKFITDIGINFQLAPPHAHRRNSVERCIRTCKNHLIATFSSTDKDFPLHLWDRMLPQALITLNHLRGSRINPILSAFA